ncbi:MULTISPECIES: hypothetical protein [Mycetohabitans]|uniref:hypothetical protein n=1 Tax=Mycetohabitans TaxID=2571159 RepID=UPI0032463014|nr:hypothetical protein [Mycetohabitans sp. B3]
MVVDNFHIRRIAICELETYVPLVINADALLADSISLHGLQLISRRNLQKIQSNSSVQLLQFPYGDRLDSGEAGNALVVKKRFRALL